MHQRQKNLSNARLQATNFQTNKKTNFLAPCDEQISSLARDLFMPPRVMPPVTRVPTHQQQQPKIGRQQPSVKNVFTFDIIGFSSSHSFKGEAEEWNRRTLPPPLPPRRIKLRVVATNLPLLWRTITVLTQAKDRKLNLHQQQQRHRRACERLWRIGMKKAVSEEALMPSLRSRPESPFRPEQVHVFGMSTWYTGICTFDLAKSSLAYTSLLTMIPLLQFALDLLTFRLYGNCISA